jgi:hypothetical protein
VDLSEPEQAPSADQGPDEEEVPGADAWQDSPRDYSTPKKATPMQPARPDAHRALRPGFVLSQATHQGGGREDDHSGDQG